jgi:hypothetical protein
MHELFGLTRFSAHMDVGGPSHQLLMRSIEIFGTKIAPKVREALKQNKIKEETIANKKGG